MTRISLYTNNPLSTLPKSGRLACKYPMASYQGLTDRELNLPVHFFIAEVFGFTSMFKLHNSISEFQWLIATLIY